MQPTAPVAQVFPRLRTAPVEFLPLPEALVCDLDGTLVDTMPILADIAQENMHATYGTPIDVARERYLGTCGIPFRQQLEVIYPGDTRNDGCAARFEAAKPARCGQAQMLPATLAALRSLARRGVRVVVSSNNGIENVELFARVNPFPFSLLCGFGDGMHKGKPHFDRIERELGIPRHAMLFTGDSLHDGDIAKAEGVPFVGVATTFAREAFAAKFPQYRCVRAFGELAALFG